MYKKREQALSIQAVDDSREECELHFAKDIILLVLKTELLDSHVFDLYS